MAKKRTDKAKLVVKVARAIASAVYGDEHAGKPCRDCVVSARAAIAAISQENKHGR